MKTPTIITSVALLAVSTLMIAPSVSYAKAASKAGKADTEQKADTAKENTDSIEFKKSIADSKVCKGMIDAYFGKDGKLILALPDSVFDHAYLLASRVDGVSETTDLVAGEMNVTPIVIRFSRDDNTVFMHLVQKTPVINSSDPIFSSYQKNFSDPIVKGFKIKMKEAGHSYIDVTNFFMGDEKLITPIKDPSPIAMLLSGKKGIDGSYYEDASGIIDVKSFPENVIIKSRLAYTTDKVTKPYTVIVARSIVRLPDVMMRSRLQDNRVGYFYDTKELYSSEIDGVKPYQIINRFRVEPRDEDLEAYYAGELVEPKRQIVFYIDSAFPEKWRPAVKEGVEYWNKAFEAAGFKNVVEARNFPTDDPDFDSDDVRRNCIRYCVTPTANAMGSSYVDPRTGEILGADVIWYHNVIQLVHDWRFTQTGAVDPRVHTEVFPDSIMHESLTYVAAHEVGHCLGLMHNMGASYAFSVEDLRDPEFTQQYGTTPSIMDYARNNYVAQPGDLERGVRLTPPPIGVYDIHAINWGYRLFPESDDLFAERPLLEKIIREHDGDPKYEFGAQQILGIMDPTDQTEDLSNDLMRAGDLSISNLRLIMENFEDWAGVKGEDYPTLYEKYVNVLKQYSRHISHVIPYIGGVRFREIRQKEDTGDARIYIPKYEQKKAMQWLLNEARTCGWLEPADLMMKFDEPQNWRQRMERTLVGCFISPVVLGRIKAGYERNPSIGYKVEDFLDDVTDEIFIASLRGEALNDTEINLQSTAIASFAKASGLDTFTSSKAALADVDAVAEFNSFMQLASGPAVACSADRSMASSVSDETRAFFRVAMGDNPLPESQMKPLLARQLRRIRSIYSKAAKKTSDTVTKEYYIYQLRVLDRLLE
ncbi:MAG: zinc-dependent metalloprotease [Muribaculaceae bacterium]|nr:zinc-dependent metalloprotease [Muribaculaceae bacterium]